MFAHEFFKDPTLPTDTGNTGLDPAAVEAIIDAHVTEAYLDAKNLSATTLKDTRTAPTELPPAKYARIYEAPGQYDDVVFHAINADNANTAAIAEDANRLANVDANQYARKYDGTVATQHTVHNANHLGTYEASMYAQKTDLTGFIKTTDLVSYAKQNDGTVATQHTVYNALNLGGMEAADYLNIPQHIQYFGSSNRVWIDILAANGMNIPQTALTTGQGDYAKYIYLYRGGIPGGGSGDLRMRHSSWYPSGQRNNVELCMYNDTGGECQFYMPSDTPFEGIQGSGAVDQTMPSQFFRVSGRSLIQLKYCPPTSAGGSGGRWIRIL